MINHSILGRAHLIAFMILCFAVFAQGAGPAEDFWKSLSGMCGKAYEGKVVAAPSSDTTFSGKRIVMDVSSCQLEKIKINLLVGSDRSRTWVVRYYDGRLLLKHEHRGRDGRPAEPTNYGGWTQNAGLSNRQVFPADEETTMSVPEAASNVWWLEIDDGKTFTYNLQRIGTDRYYSLSFDLSISVPVPRLVKD